MEAAGVFVMPRKNRLKAGRMELEAGKEVHDDQAPHPLPPSPGPRGTFKMLVRGAGQIKITKDGNYLLHTLTPRSPLPPSLLPSLRPPRHLENARGRRGTNQDYQGRQRAAARDADSAPHRFPHCSHSYCPRRHHGTSFPSFPPSFQPSTFYRFKIASS